MELNNNRNLYLLIAGQFISQIGDKFYALALAFWVLQTTGSPSKMGLVLFFSMAPSVLIGFFAGGFIDRFDRKAILIASDIFRGLVIVTVVIFYYLGLLSMVAIIAAQVLLSIFSTFFNPTVQAVIPQITDREHIAAANARSQLASGMALVLGPVLGGLAVSYLGYTFVFVFNAASFFAAALFEAFLRMDKTTCNSMKTESVKQNIKAGYSYIFKRKNILVIIIIVAAVHFFVGSIQVIMPVLANMLKGNGARNLGFIETFFGLGVVAAALLLNLFSINRREEKFMFGGITALGLTFIIFAVLAAGGFQYNVPFFVIFLLVSLIIIVISSAYQVILQKNVENNMAGRVFSIVGSTGNLTLPAATLVFGFLLERFHIYQLSGLCGAALVLVSVLLFGIYGRKPENTV